MGKSAGVSKDAGPVTNNERWERPYLELAKWEVREELEKAMATREEEQRKEHIEKSKTTREEEESKEQSKMKSTGVLKDAGRVTQYERWERNYEQLTKFINEKGHCSVPRNKTFKTLARWVKAQRRAYRTNGGTLSGDRVARLESIGFTWRGQTGNDEEMKEEVTEHKGTSGTLRLNRAAHRESIGFVLKQGDTTAHSATCESEELGCETNCNIGVATAHMTTQGLDLATSCLLSEGIKIEDRQELLSTEVT